MSWLSSSIRRVTPGLKNKDGSTTLLPGIYKAKDGGVKVNAAGALGLPDNWGLTHKIGGKKNDPKNESIFANQANYRDQYNNLVLNNNALGAHAGGNDSRFDYFKSITNAENTNKIQDKSKLDLMC